MKGRDEGRIAVRAGARQGGRALLGPGWGHGCRASPPQVTAHSAAASTLGKSKASGTAGQVPRPRPTCMRSVHREGASRPGAGSQLHVGSRGSESQDAHPGVSPSGIVDGGTCVDGCRVIKVQHPITALRWGCPGVLRRVVRQAMRAG